MPVTQTPQTLGTPDSPKMNMGMKYPAGMGIVVARISIQNCGWWDPRGAEVRDSWTGVGKGGTGQWAGESPGRKRTPRHTPIARVWH